MYGYMHTNKHIERHTYAHDVHTHIQKYTDTYAYT